MNIRQGIRQGVGSSVRVFARFHPITVLIYFVSVLIITMFTVNPVFSGIALMGGTCFLGALERPKVFFKSLMLYVFIFIIIALTNPLFSHNGVTILFFMNGNPVTLESIVYGVNIAGMIVAVIYWCKCYNEIMTGDKFLYLFGRVIPRLSVVLSMALRFIPLYIEQVRKVGKTQEALGLYPRESYLDKLKGGVQVFSAVMTWALENSVDTGNSMKARGFFLGGRSNYLIFRFRVTDLIFTLLNILLVIITLIGIGVGEVNVTFYPKLSELPVNPLSIVSYLAFGLLCLLPVIIEIKEAFKWKYLISKI